MPDQPFIGEIYASAINFAPQGYLPCDGRLLPISQYTPLFSLLGTTFGGDGSTTFGLPDLRGRVAVGMGQGPGLSNYTLGQASGTESVSLVPSNLPAQTGTLSGNAPLSGTATATLNAQNSAGNLATPAGNALATASAAGEPAQVYTNATTAPVAMASGSVTVDLSQVQVPLNGVQVTVNGGGGVPVPIMQPYLAINYYIAYEGVFPSRP